MKNLLQDIRHNWRTILRSPGFAVVAVLTLAVAIGANTVVFSVLNTMFLHPLNVPQSESLFALERSLAPARG